MLRSLLCASFLTAVLVAPAFSDEVILEQGDVIHGRIAEKTEVKIILDHPIFGRVDIPMAAVKSVRFDSQIAADERMEGGIEESAAAVVAEQEKKEEEAWKSRLELGFSGSNGNNRSKSWHIAFDTRKEDPKGLWKADARWDASESSGVETKNRFTSGIRRDWNLGDSPWVVFAEARYDRDRFTEWDQRASLSAGFGYQFVKNETTAVKGRIGLSATKEWGSADDEHVRPEGLLGVDVTHQLTERQTLEASSTYYPDLADTPEYRLVNTASWTIRLDEGGGISLKFGIAHELDTHRDDPFKRQDFTYFGVMVFDF
jgi:putative salt-induced outer membrane protein YdiY